MSHSTSWTKRAGNAMFGSLRGGRGRHRRPGRQAGLRLERLEDRQLLAINVAVVGVPSQDNTGFVAIRDQLNNDTYFDFSATLVYPDQVDTVAELNAFDAVVIGNNGYPSGDPFDNVAFTSALRSWVEGGGGLVATGWTIYGAGLATGTPVGDIDAIVPVNTGGGYSYFGNGVVAMDGSVAHPITDGIGSFTVSNCEFPVANPQNSMDAGATVLATINGQRAVVVGQPGSGRSVYLGPAYAYYSSSANNLRTGAADRLLEEAVSWAADRTDQPDRTAPTVVSTTPGDGSTLSAPSLGAYTVTFSEPVTASTAQYPANYRLEGPDGLKIPIATASLGSDGTTVTLGFTAQSAAGTYRLYVGSVTDLAGNVMPALGGYEVPVYYGSGSDDYYLWSSTLGDFNNDGLIDLIAWRNGSNAFDRFLGQPGGDFDGGSLIYMSPSSSFKQEITSADLDGDGNLDLIAAEDSMGVGVYFGHGDGTFVPFRQIYSAVNGARGLAIADVAGDSRPDLIVASLGYGLTTLVNDGTRNVGGWQPVLSYGPGVTNVHLTDLNGDGTLDAVTDYSGYTGYIRLGDPNARGHFNASTTSFYLSSYNSDRTALADLDQDGWPDLIAGPNGTSVRYLTSVAPFIGPWQSLNSEPGAYVDNVTTADLDGDGDLDVLKGGYGNGVVSISYNLNQSQHSFSNQSISVGADYIFQLHTADLNGDGLPDIIGTSYQRGGVFVLASRKGAPVSSVTLVTNHSPVTLDDDVTVDEDSDANALAVLANDQDADGDPLAITGVTRAGHGSVAISDDGTGLLYTPASDYFGGDSFTYTVSDGRGGTSTATVNVLVTSINDAPTFAMGSNPTVLEDEGGTGSHTIANWATALSPGANNEAGQGLAFLITGNDNPGMFAVAPVIDPNGTLSFTTAPDANGVAMITVVLRDNGGTSHGGRDSSDPRTFTIAVTPVNDHPIVNDDHAETNEDASVVIDVLTNDRPGPLTATDEVGQALTITMLNGLAPTVGVPIPTPHGAVTLNANGTVTYTPAADYNGPDGFSYTVQDDGTPPQSDSASG